MADDELVLPTVPEPKPDDPEDVSWALSTAEAMWARGDNAEGVKWIRRAAEAASEAENDMRALELAKAAADLAGLISRRGGTIVDATPFVAENASNSPTSNSPSTARSPGSVPPSPRSRPPPGMPTAATKPAKPPLPTGANRSSPIPSAKRTNAPRPLATGSSVPAPALSPAPAPVPRATPSRPPGAPKTATTAEKKPRRRSRDNLDAEARAALGVSDTAPQKRLDLDAAAAALEARAPIMPAEPPPRHAADSDATMIAHVDDINAHRDRSAAEWDASPTQDLREDELAELDKRHPIIEDRETHLGAPPMETAAPIAEPTQAPRKLPSRAPPAMLHDPKIQTSQAVRVVIWRDANGVHLAPAGTAVSAITIDAVLVVLDPAADLTAWLSQQR